MLSSIRGKGKGTIIRLAPIFFLTVALLAAGSALRPSRRKARSKDPSVRPKTRSGGSGVALRSEDPGALSDIFGRRGRI